MSRIILSLLIIFGALGFAAAQEQPRPLAQAMQAMRAGDWDGALRLAAADGPVARDVIEWHRLRAGRGDFDDLRGFLERRGDWPGLPWLLKRSEDAAVAAPAAQRLAFFDRHAPQTAEGVLGYARALLAANRRGEAEAGLVLAWRTLAMSAETHAAYLRAYPALLAPHHDARLDHMIWTRDLAQARRVLPLASPAHRSLAAARIGLIEQVNGVDALIAAVPDTLRDDPGLAYERFVWRHRKGRDADARALLDSTSVSAATLGRPEAWSDRRRRLVRDAMRAGDARAAYRMAAGHFLTEGADFADLEWLAGFVALRQLNDPATALRHFTRFDAAVESPISKGRAGYWLGRAHEAAGNAEAARAAYGMGALYQTSFYGLLAAERAGLPFDMALAGRDTPTWRDADFVRSDVFKAGLLLLSAGELSLGERFLTHLTESLDADQAARLGAMALELERPHLAVMIGKRAAQAGITLPAPYYALHPVHRMDLPMAPDMILAIARRESEFDPTVVSGAGARGLMQLMPATAGEMARVLGVSAGHDTARLTREPDYNARLGAQYLSQMAARFDGNVVMMSAAYNAGPSRPERWMETYGDPRDGTPDIVDWIEFVPFTETRNYIMRVTESLPIYRARLGLDPLPVPFSRELAGSTLRAFAPKGE
ncbi:MAG: transglycosylase SLT domain-containing protein [Rhodobacteraceae bacterium]|nr:transglycosylase SLT domain-containing protein [Paracoccaceae bacterium]